MARLKTVIDAALFKPVSIFRDAALLWAVGLGSSSDAFFAALGTVLLGQGLAVGALANAWIPAYLRTEARDQPQLLAASFRGELRFTFAAVMAASVLLGLGGHLAGTNAWKYKLEVLAALAPLGGLAYLLGWIGNYLLAVRSIRVAQFVWTLPSLIIVASAPAVKWVSPQLGGGLDTAIAVVYIAYGTAVLIGLKMGGASNCLPEWRPLRPMISTRYRLIASCESFAFALLTYSIFQIPGALGPGVTAVLVLVSRVYGAFSVVVVSPLSQLLLLSTARSGRSVQKEVLSLLAIFCVCAVLIPLGAYVGLRSASTLNLNVNEAWAQVPQMSLAWIPIFLGMAAIQVFARALGVLGKTELPSMTLMFGYAVATGIVLWAAPSFWTKMGSVYAVLTSLVLLLACMLFRAERGSSD